MTEIEQIKKELSKIKSGPCDLNVEEMSAEKFNFYANINLRISSLTTTIESQKEEIEKLKGILERLPSKIMQLDSWADIEELTYPLTDPTEENQLEWFEEFNRRLDDHVQSCFDGELYELESQEGEEVNDM